jgi:signal transduction histidine kinase
MNELTDFFGKLFYYGDWPPITECGKWTDVEIFSIIAGNALFGVACFFLMGYLLVRIKYFITIYSGLVYVLTLVLLASLFTVTVTDIMAFWLPVYRLKGLAICLTSVSGIILVFIALLRGGLSKAIKYKQLYEMEIAEKEEADFSFADTVASMEQQITFITLRANRFETIMASCQHPVIITDNKLRLIYANGAAQSLFPDSFEEMTGSTQWLSMLLADDVQIVHEQCGSLQSLNDMVVFPVRMPGNGNYLVQMECLLQLLKLPGIEDPCIMVELTDVTDYVVRISELIGTQEKQEKRIKDVARYAEAATKEIDTFSYAITHDLKAPLRIISGYGELCITDLKKTDNADALKYLEVILANTRQLGTMVDSLANLTRITRKDLVLVQADMDSIVKSVVNELHSTKNITADINYNTILPSVCDSVLMRHVWFQLLSNAIKFSSHNEKPQIQIGCQAKDDSIMYFVADNGVGFDMQYAEKLFGIFQRLHRKSEFEGSGLGLATAQRILLKHGGFIWAESSENGGATFYFTLPKVT